MAVSRKRILEEGTITNRASKLLFSEPSSEVEIIEMEVRTSEFSNDCFLEIGCSDREKSSESVLVPPSDDQRANKVKEARIHVDATQSKAVFSKPGLLLGKHDPNVEFSPRGITPPMSANQGINKEKIYKQMELPSRANREESKEGSELNIQNKQAIEMLPSQNHLSKEISDEIMLTDRDQASQNISKDQQSTSPKNGLIHSWGKPNVVKHNRKSSQHCKRSSSSRIKENQPNRKTSHPIKESTRFSKKSNESSRIINQNQSQDCKDFNEDTFNDKNQQNTSPKEQKMVMHHQDPENFQERQTPKKNTMFKSNGESEIDLRYMTNPHLSQQNNSSMELVNDTCNFQSRQMYKTQPTYMEDIQSDHMLISQLSEAHQTISEQDSLIMTLRIDNKKLKDLLSQKDEKLKSVQSMKMSEANEMNKFYLDRLKADRIANSNDTPRIQNENQMIREQIKVLLDEAKDRNHDINRLKKLINMYELQKEDFEHKLTLMRNKEIRLEAEIEQISERYKIEESKNRQLKMEYDELKFQIQRQMIFKDIKCSSYKPQCDLYTISEDFQHRDTYKPPSYKTLIPENPAATTFHTPYPSGAHNPARKTEQSSFSDTLYRKNDLNSNIQNFQRKNMKSSVGDLLRWEDPKDSHQHPSSIPNPIHSKARSISSPPVRNRIKAEPEAY
ncbi:unnamed protein product [Moneuplotes crassus]|uniref:Uncharacterized protein n=1 Tax=Euplotes crassus TaxID=5936 RepID=A0AAD1Y744_EUPCR|nr:unnamed protein product [Moneuplotes crassus]